MKINKVHHVAVLCSDYPRSLQFYTQVLGLEVLGEHYRAERDSYKTDLALHGEFVIELFSFPNPPKRVSNPEAAGLRHLAFEVDDIDANLAELDSKGIPHEAPRVDPFTGKRFVFFADPDGLPIEFYER
jgi:glyoxylase I family protein